MDRKVNILTDNWGGIVIAEGCSMGESDLRAGCCMAGCCDSC